MPQVHKTQAQLALHIGAVAREARTKAGFTQEEAAERVGLATEVYGRLERGNMLPSLPTLVKLCRALAIDANPLLGFSSPQPPAWLLPETPSETEPPNLRRLFRAARKLEPRQLSALNVVAGALLPTSRQQTPGPSKVTTRRAPSGRGGEEPAGHQGRARLRQSELDGSVTVPGFSMAASAARSR